MESFESLQEIFIKAEDIKQEVEDEQLLSCSIEEDSIEMDVNVKEEVIEMNVNVKEESIDMTVDDIYKGKTELEPNEFVELKTEHLLTVTEDIESVIIKQEDILGISDEYNPLDPDDDFESNPKRKLSEDSEQHSSPKKAKNDSVAALLDHCYDYSGAVDQDNSDKEGSPLNTG